MSRVDWMRSWIKSAVDSAQDGVLSAERVVKARERLADMKDRKVSLRESDFLSAMAKVPGVASLSVRIDEPGIFVDAFDEAGEAIRLCIVPERAFSAPRGAKELLFRVEPAAAVGTRVARSLVGVCAGVIAHRAWAAVLPPPRASVEALVERDGAGLRADLRSVPAVRRLLERGGMGMFLDAFVIDSFDFARGRVRVGFRWPPIPV